MVCSLINLPVQYNDLDMSMKNPSGVCAMTVTPGKTLNDFVSERLITGWSFLSFLLIPVLMMPSSVYSRKGVINGGGRPLAGYCFYAIFLRFFLQETFWSLLQSYMGKDHH
jgi:hypothetical protein